MTKEVGKTVASVVSIASESEKENVPRIRRCSPLSSSARAVLASVDTNHAAMEGNLVLDGERWITSRLV